MNTFTQYIAEKEILKGGLGDGQTIETLAKKHNVPVEDIRKQLIKGIRVEFEHDNKKSNNNLIIDITDKQITDFVDGKQKELDDKVLKILQMAKEISLDHLTESPVYYTDLHKMEKAHDKEVIKEQAFTSKESAQNYCDNLKKSGIKCKPICIDKQSDYWQIEYENVEPKQKLNEARKKKHKKKKKKSVYGVTIPKYGLGGLWAMTYGFQGGIVGDGHGHGDIGGGDGGDGGGGGE